VALSESEVVDAAKVLLKLREEEQRRLKKIARYMKGDASSVYVPRGARQEYKWLIQRAKVNVLPLVVTVVAQALYVDGYRAAKSDKNTAAWEIWQANRMDARQHGLHRTTLKYGVGYNVVLPGKPGPVITPKSPRRMTAFYEDPVDDEWPLYAVEETVLNTLKGKVKAVWLYDDNIRYAMESREREGGKLRIIRAEEHGLKVCPVVRYLNGDDLDGDDCVRGEIEPLFEMQDQLNATTFNLLMAQQYAAFRQRWVTGMAPPLDENGAPIEPFNSAVNRLWVAEDHEAKFGEFGQTDLGGYLSSQEATVRHIATVSQTPPHHLLGQMANLSAEALAAAESGLQRKIGERKSSYGESHEQTLRLAALAAGDQKGWEDTSAQVVWRDTEARALASAVDALGKMAQMLQIPPQELWEKVPGVTQTDVTRWKAAAKKADAKAQLNEIVDRQMQAAQGPDEARQQPPQGEQAPNGAAPPPGQPPAPPGAVNGRG
jgi:hypothetical protein